MGKLFFGLELHEYYDANTILAEIQLGEQLGYDAVWLGDSQMIWREMYVLLGAAAKVTSRVLLGTGVTNPITRLPVVTASAITTLQELSGGRAVLGVGTGDSSVRTLGLKPANLATLERFVSDVRDLCFGRPVGAAKGEVRLSFGAPEKCPPIVVAARGPKSLRLGGRIADGVIFSTGRSGSILQNAIGYIQAGLKERTLPSARFQIIFMRPVAIAPERKKAFAAVRPHVARTLLSYPWEMSEAAATAKKKLEEVYNYYEHMNPTALHQESIPDEVVPEFAIAGTAADCREQVVDLFEQGIDQLHIRPYSVDGAPRSSAIEAFAKEVIKPLRHKS
ncbi:MAG: LLM class flavin-dependent oxidoreductase [Deltaproteobacteria bacterium]|nr:LLM class flavin-dependent oxidoreductase [Deltaproteobacteria bacterium]